jgi:D-glycero-alpha-D-manno-heptose-7-phosphate kinase
LDVDPGWVGERMTIFDTGISHHSGMVNWQVIRRRLDGEAVSVDAFEAIAEAARRCRAELIAGNEDGVGEAVADEWRARKRLAPEVCPSDLDAIVAAGLAAGAAAVKACGAGGGGSVLVWHVPGAREEIITALESAAPAGRVVATGVATIGCRVLTIRECAASDPA